MKENNTGITLQWREIPRAQSDELSVVSKTRLNVKPTQMHEQQGLERGPVTLKRAPTHINRTELRHRHTGVSVREHPEHNTDAVPHLTWENGVCERRGAALSHSGPGAAAAVRGKETASAAESVLREDDVQEELGEQRRQWLHFKISGGQTSCDAW